jgi:hypothetical protein
MEDMKLINEELVEALLCVISDYGEELAKDWQIDVIVKELRGLKDEKK